MLPRLVAVPRDVDVLEGGSGRLTCDIDSFRQPEIRWSFNDEPISHGRFETSGSGGRLLLLRAIKEDDAGIYRCTVETLLGPISADTQLRVYSQLFVFFVFLFSIIIIMIIII